MEKVLLSGETSVSINVPQSLINHKNPPSEALAPLRRSNSLLENVNPPLAGRLADSEVSSDNGDATVNCVHNKAGTLAGKEETQLEDFNF